MLLVGYLEALLTGNKVAPSLTGATGKRFAMNLKDLQDARTKLAVEDTFRNNQMSALVPSSLIKQLFPAGDIVTTTAMNGLTEAERRNGVMYKVEGFKIYERSSVLRVKSDSSIKSVDAVVEKWRQRRHIALVGKRCGACCGRGKKCLRN